MIEYLIAAYKLSRNKLEVNPYAGVFSVLLNAIRLKSHIYTSSPRS